MSEPDVKEREHLWAGKRGWHAQQAGLPLREKFRILLELQRQDHPILEARGALEPWQTPWAIEP